MNRISSGSSQAASVRKSINRYESTLSSSTDDLLAVEEPLEIQIVQQSGVPGSERTISITMRTPGNDHELAIGFLHGEGILSESATILNVRHCGPPSPDKGYQNVVQVELADDALVDESQLSRNFYTTSSCGVCGKTSIDAVNVAFPKIERTEFVTDHRVVKQLPDRLRSWQTEFKRTGGIHASASFNVAGEIQRVREDVGRHNALDKLIGSYVLESNSPIASYGLLLSGRASFELIQKATMAQIPFVAAIGSPSNLAVELAEERKMTLIGFLRDSGFNIYTHHHTIQ